jgi:hypothetical protein
LTLDRYTHLGLCDLTDSVNSLPPVPTGAIEKEVLKATGTAGPEVPTVVPSGAESGAVRSASATLRIASGCTEDDTSRKKHKAVTSNRDREMGTNSRQSALDCTDDDKERERGPSRIRTGDSGFAIRCLTTWRRGRAIVASGTIGTFSARL